MSGNTVCFIIFFMILLVLIKTNSQVAKNSICVCSGGFAIDNNTNSTHCKADCNKKARLTHEIDCVFPFQFNGEWHDTCVDFEPVYVSVEPLLLYNQTNNTNTTNQTTQVVAKNQLTTLKMKYLTNLTTLASKGNNSNVTLLESKKFHWCSLDPVFKGRYAKCEQRCPRLARNLVKNDGMNHSVCLEKAKDFIGYLPTEYEKEVIVNKTNEFRSYVSVEAADMRAVTWDPVLARMAQRWAENGDYEHDCWNCKVPLNNPSLTVGQNVFMSLGSPHDQNYWKLAVTSWYNEIKYFAYGNGSTTGNYENIAHYSQLVNGKSNRVGCGLARRGIQILAVCNYAEALLSAETPYTAGKACSQCPKSKCVNKLCVCDKVCHNYGELNLSTCTCECPAYATGELCEKLVCNKSDSRYGCWNTTDTELCEYSNTLVLCPHMCGICTHKLGPL